MTDKALDILNPSGQLIRRHTLSANCTRRFSLMSEDSVTLRFWLRDAVRFPVGSSVGDFFITQEQLGKWNAATGGWDYELKFDAYYWAWKNKILRYVVNGVDSAKETTFTLTATIATHAQVIKNCLDLLGITYGGSSFRIDVDSSVSGEVKLVRYENLSILGGIQAIAEAFECEWWVKENAICFGRCENSGSQHVFEAGLNTSSISWNNAKSEAPNRLYVYGSDRNLPPNYRKTDGNDTIGGVVLRRLMLPEGIPYLQTMPNIPEAEIVEQVVVLDSVYPKTELTVSEIPEEYTSEGEDEEGEATTETFYRLKYGDDFLFSESYILPDEELHIVFQSGLLNGMEFGARFNPKGLNEKNAEDGSWNPDAQIIEIVANEDYGRKLPDDVLKPQVGDKFILYGWDSTKMEDLGLIDDAEQELLEEGQKALDEYSKDLSSCTCPMAWDYMKPLFATNSQPKPGDVVTIMDSAHFGNGGRKSRIIGFEYRLDKPYAECTYTCGENVSVSRLKSLEQKIDGLAKSGTKVQMQNSLDFLSKRYNDRTPYKLSADQGFEAGTFAEGISGGMLGVDKETKQSFLEVDRIFARVRAYFENLTVIEAEALAGRQYITPGGGVQCTSVETVHADGFVTAEPSEETEAEHGATTAYRCLFLSEQDGEKRETKIKAGDQVIAQTFNAKAGTDNKVGNRRWWRLVTAVSNDTYTDETGNRYGYIEVSATDCEAGSDAPAPGDEMVQLGNRTDASRQAAMIFSTVDSDAPSIRLFTGIGGGASNAEHYSLEGHDIVCYGYDPLKGNAYFTCYGDTYIGDRDGSTFVSYDKDGNKMTIKADLEVGSTIDGKSVEDYVKEIAPEFDDSELRGLIGDAQTSADNAQGTADAASGKADSAQSAADKAAQDAQDAQDAADNAQSSADAASAMANTAYSAATAAQAAADSLKYLKDSLNQALADSTHVSGGLLLTTMIALGYTEGETRHILSGMNGSYNPELGGRTPAAWYGGNMIDRFDPQGLPYQIPPANAATSMIRMDGSAYFAAGNVGFNTDGSGWLAGSNIRWDAAGAITFGNGIKIDLGGGDSTTLGGLNDTIGSLLTLLNQMQNVLIPVDSSGNRVAWDSKDLFAVRSVKGLYSDEFISARGLNPYSNGGVVGATALSGLTDVLLSNPTSGQVLVYNGSKWVNQTIQPGGLGEPELAAYLTANNYARKSDIPAAPDLSPYALKTEIPSLTGYARLTDIPSLTGYATEAWVEGKGYITASALTGYATLTYVDAELDKKLNASDFNAFVAKFNSMFMLEDDSTLAKKKKIKALFGLYTDDFLSARGLNPWQNTGDFGLNETQLAEYLTKNNYAKKSDIPAAVDLTGYAKEQWVEGKGYITAAALTGYATQSWVEGKNYASLTYVNAELAKKLDASTFTTFKTGYDTWKSSVDAFIAEMDSMFRKEADASQAKGYRIKALFGLYTDEFLSARGINPQAASGGAFNLMREWTATENGNKQTQYALGANLGYELKGRLDNVRTLTVQKNGTAVGTFNPLGTANVTINISDVASAATLSSHTGNGTIHITAAERTAWNNAATNLSSIMGTDADNVINKWEEIVAFLDTYTEADTLANLLGNKVDKTVSVSAGTGLTGGGTLEQSRTLSLATSGVTAGTYTKVTVDVYGRVTAGSNPTTLAGYGITDAYTKTEADGKYVTLATEQSITGTKTFNTLKIANTGNGTARPTTGIAVNGILGTMASNDCWAIFGYGTASDAGYMEIATGDNGNEPIYVAQYTGGSPLSTNATRAHGITLMNASGNQVFNETTVDRLTVANTSGVGHIMFSRGNFNYFTAPTSGVFAFVANGKGVGDAPSDFVIAENLARPGSNNVVNLGDSSHRWANVYSTLGNFSGLITATSGVQIGSTADIGWYIGSAGSRIVAGSQIARGVNVGSLLVSNAWADSTKVPTNGIYVKGALKIGEVTIEYDATAKGLKVSGGGLYSESYISARGLNDAGGTGNFNLMRTWVAAENNPNTNYALGANLGWELYNNKLNATKAAIEGLLTGTITSHQHDYIVVQDVRDGSRGPDYFGDKKFSVWFNNVGTPNSNSTWWSGIHIKGWTGIYAAWELAGVATSSIPDNNLYFRTGIGTTWNAWQTVVTSANISSYLGNYVTLDGIQDITGRKTFKTIRIVGSATATTANRNSTAVLSFMENNYDDQFGIWGYFSGTGSAQKLFIGGSGTGATLASTENGTTFTPYLTIEHTTGNLTVLGKIIKSGGTSAQFLKADGSVDSNTYLTTGSASSTYVKKSGDTMTGGLYINSLLYVSNTSARRLVMGGEASYVWLDCRDADNNVKNNFVLYDDKTTTSKYMQAPYFAATSTTLCTNVNADMLDGCHRGYTNGYIPIYTQFPGNQALVNSGYNTEANKINTEYFLKGLCKWAIANYSGTEANIMLQGAITPNSRGWCVIHLYANELTDVSTGFPKYCSGQYNDLGGNTHKFGTTNYEWYYYIEAHTSSNVASATKLADNTARTAWGQTFFTNGQPQSISGNMTSVGDVTFSPSTGSRQLKITTVGSISLKAATGGWAWGLLSYQRDGITLLGYSAGSYGSSDTLNYHFYGGDYNSPSMVILPTGNVGIGTVSPSYKLEVAGTIGASGRITSKCSAISSPNVWVSDYAHFRAVSSAAENYYTFGMGVSEDGFGILQAGHYGIGAVPILLNPKGGNVGIGNTSPAYKLDVNGTAYATHLIVGGTDATAHLAFSRGSYNYITAPTSGFIAFVVNGKACGSATTEFLITNGVVQPGAQNNAVALGTSSYRWSNVYSTLGNFSGLITASAGIKIGECTITWETGKGLKFSEGIYSEKFVSAKGLNSSGNTTGGLIQTVYGSGDLGKTFNDSTKTDTFNAYTINAINTKVSTIQSSLSGYQAKGSYVTTDTAQTITGAKTFVTGLALRFSVNTSNAIGIAWRKTDGTTTLQSILAHNTANRIIINPIGSADAWSDAVGKYSLIVGNNELTYNTYSILHTNNYAATLDNIYVKKAGDTMTGILQISQINEQSGANAILAYKKSISGVTDGQWTVGTIDIQGVIRSGNSSLIHYRHGVGSLTIWDSGNDGAGSGLDADLLDGYHNGDVSAADARYLKINAYISPSDYATVKEGKDALVTLLTSQPEGIGFPIRMGASFINEWNKESAASYASSQVAVIKLGGGYSGSTYGQWLMAGYGTNRIYIIGRTNNNWTELQTLAYLSDNVASATKLQTSRNIWGQSFNGSANVSGEMAGVGNITFNSGGGSRGLSIDINGNISLKAATTGWAWGLNSYTNDGVTLLGCSAGTYGSKDVLNYHYYGGDYNSPNMVILPSGNVGIGTVSPSYKLEVAGTIGASGRITSKCSAISSPNVWVSDYAHFRAVSSAAENYYTFGMGVSEDGFGILQAGHYGIGAVPILLNPKGGNVGIGNTSPAYKLDVAGAIRASSWLRTTGAVGWYSETYGGGWYMSDTTWIRTYGDKSIYQNKGTLRTDGTLQVGNNGSTFIATNGGYVGINNSSPIHRLDVNGNIRTTADIMLTGGSFAWTLSPNGDYLNIQSSSDDAPAEDIFWINGKSGNFHAEGSFSTPKTTTTYLAGNQGNAIINSTATAGTYTMLAKMNSTNGYFTHGVYGKNYSLYYTAKTTVDAKTNSATYGVTLMGEDGHTTLNSLTVGPDSSPAFKSDANGNVLVGSGTMVTGGYWHFRRHVIIGGCNFFFTGNTAGTGQGMYMAQTTYSSKPALVVMGHDNKTYKTTVARFEYDGAVFVSAGLYSNGYVSARGQNTSSDARLKRNLTPFEMRLRDIAGAPSVSFDWLSDGRRDLGSVAQYWRGVNPSLTPEGRDGYLTLQYGKAALLASISIAKEVVSHEERIAALEKEVESLREENMNLKLELERR